MTASGIAEDLLRSVVRQVDGTERRTAVDEEAPAGGTVRPGNLFDHPVLREQVCLEAA